MSMTRRSFMSGAAAMAAIPSVLGQTKRVYKFAVVGCGGRGTRAVKDFFDAVEQLGGEAKLVAVFTAVSALGCFAAALGVMGRYRF